MDVGWNFRREHLRLQQFPLRDPQRRRSAQRGAAECRGWHFFRDGLSAHQGTLEVGDKMARARHTDQHHVHLRVLGLPGRFSNRPASPAHVREHQRVGMPTWSDDDQKPSRRKRS
jgi:aminobenzoyl-glutamate utilization protein B